MENNSILVEIPPLGAVFPDFILIGFKPVIPANVTLFLPSPVLHMKSVVTIVHICVHF